MKTYDEMLAYLMSKNTAWLFMPYRDYQIAYPSHLIEGTVLPYFKGILDLGHNPASLTSFEDIFESSAEVVQSHTPNLDFAVVFNPHNKSYLVVGDIFTAVTESTTTHFMLR
ncbi:MAG: hypothetical protein [Podoviridae sp. ctLUJ1]|nr:MAG: hypothetical protein [Podoviridae sp. ctLUJ1]